MRVNKTKHCSIGFELLEDRRLMSTLTVGAGQQYTTLQAAANAVQAGDTVMVQAGTYAGFELIGKVSGTANAPITFDFEAGAKITSADSSTGDAIDIENCNYVTVEGATITNPNGSITRAGIRLALCDNSNLLDNNISGMGAWGLYTSHSSNTVIKGNTADDSIGQHGLYVANSSSNVQILDNTFYGNANCGIHVNGDASQGDTGVMTNITIEGNVIYGNGATGGSSINCDGVQNSIIENNLIYGNKNKGIGLYDGDSSGASINDVVANNTVIETGSAPALEIVDGSTGATVFNNIFLGTVDVDSASQSGYKSSNNITSGSVSSLFTDAANSNYQIAAGSAAAGAGVASFNGKNAPASSGVLNIGATPLGATVSTGSTSSSGSSSSGSSSSGSSSSGSSTSGSTSGSGSSSSSSGSDSSGSSSSGSSSSGSTSDPVATPPTTTQQVNPPTSTGDPTGSGTTSDTGSTGGSSSSTSGWVGHWLARHRHHCHHHVTTVAA